MNRIVLVAFATSLASAAHAQHAIPVTVDNYNRAESDASFGSLVKRGSFAKIDHERELNPLDKQGVVRANRDTLYSEGIFDLDAGPVTITLPVRLYRARPEVLSRKWKFPEAQPVN